MPRRRFTSSRWEEVFNPQVPGWLMPYSEDHIALAAEYALGTLAAEEREQVETMMAVDNDFAGIVQGWEFRLGVLNQMVGSVEPRPIIWENIRAAIGDAEPQAALVLPEPPPAAPVPEVVREIPVVDNTKVISLAKAARRWRTIGSFAGALAAALLAMVALQVYQPDALPDGIRPKPRIRTVEVKIPPPPLVPSAQYVALLQAPGGGPGFILTVDGATKDFTVRKVGATAEPGKSFELWLISDKLPRPRSLGVIGNGDFTSRPVLASYDRDVINTATFAVTVEQAGGSPDGNPHSAPVFTGKLIQTVPPGAGQEQPQK